MTFQTSQEAKETIQSLTDSIWIFSALTILSESGILHCLKEKTSFTKLKEISKIPEAILKQTINLLTKVGFLIFINEECYLAPGMNDLVTQGGIEKIASQFRVTSGITHEFIQSSRNKKLKSGWYYTDEFILQSQGILSEHIVTDCIPLSAELQKILNQPNPQFLDIGAGVGKISLKLCEYYKNVKVIALEPADKPFALAQKNIKESAYNHRIELRKNYLEDLKEENSFDIIWFPHLFFTDDIFNICLAKIWSALKPDSMLITNVLSTDTVALTLHVKQLINALYGSFRTESQMSNALANHGFKDIQSFPEIGGYKMLIAKKSSPDHLRI